MTLYDDLLRARELLDRQGYEPDPPMPPELQLLIDEFRRYGDLLAAIRGVINRWADDDSIDDQAARLVGELLVVMHEGGWR